MDFLRQYLFIIPLVVMFLCEIAKVIVEGVKSGNWHEGFFKSGGMPSSHSAFVTSLLIIVGRKLGPQSVEFAISFVFASVVWYDAMNVRRAVGQQAEILNRLQHWEHFSVRLGHSFAQVLVGIVFGAIITAVGIWASYRF
jgi:acid phosphatase family membrane protein YuiD